MKDDTAQKEGLSVGDGLVVSLAYTLRLDDGEEIDAAAGTDPFNGDTDGDGLKDGAEVFAAVARNAGVSA